LLDFLHYLVLGLGPGALYALLAVGVVLIYRGSGVVNFGLGGFALVGAAVYMELLGTGVGKAGAAVIAVLAAACLGVVVQVLVLHPIRHASPLARIVATLGVAAALDFGGQHVYGNITLNVPGFLPSGAVHIGSVVAGEDRFWILGIAVVVTAALWAAYRFSRFGIATTAIAENPRASASLGWSPMVLAILNWAFGGAVAGFAGVLLVPIIGFSPDGFSLLVVPALAAAVLAVFRSFGLALISGLVIGILESESILLNVKHPHALFGVVPTVGLDSVVPFLVVLIVLLVRGRPLPLRGELTDRLPALGNPIPRWPVIIVVFVLVALSIFAFPSGWAAAVTLSAVVALIALSVVVITGYAGQLSLAQFGLAGIGALVSSRLAAVAGLGFVPAGLVGIASAVIVGFLVAIPASRVRGVNLAVITLSLGVVITDAVLANTDWNGGAITGTVVPTPAIAGFQLGSVNNPDRWAMLCLIVLVLCCLGVSNLRRGRSGRRLIAVRDNERAAASLGVSVVTAKLYAFGVGAGLAGLAGVLLAFQYPNVDFSQYTPLQSIQIVLLSVIGGIGYVAGSVVAGIGIIGGVAQNLLNHLADTAGWFGFVLAVGFLVAVVVHPDGMADRFSVLFRRAGRALTSPLASRAAARRGRAGAAAPGPGRPGAPVPAGGAAAGTPAAPARGPSLKVRPKTLEVRDLTVRFGGVVALENVSFQVAAGTTLGLIGPNGAGKTTLVDAVCGFLPRYGGQVLLDGKRIDRLRASRRVRRGVTRSFQSLELFEDLTIADNLRIAADRGRRREYFYDLFAPRRQPLPEVAMAACEAFGLAGVLDKRPGELAYAERRAAAIARAVAAEPSVLLLDEPAAGLDPQARRELEELIRRLADGFGMAVVLIEHDVGMIMRTCDEVIALNFGRPFSRGKPEQVRRDPQLVQAYLGSAAADEPSHLPAYEEESR
jgi:ABC-type branched-subunit amino acid transport system ATPase component/ABC-type branched-subunit amino acid transport system permease subunit